MPASVTRATVAPCRSIASTWATLPPSLCVHRTCGCVAETARPLDSSMVGSASVSTTGGPGVAASKNAAATTAALAAGKVVGEQRLQVRRDAPGAHQVGVLAARLVGRDVFGYAGPHRADHRVPRGVLRGHE